MRKFIGILLISTLLTSCGSIWGGNNKEKTKPAPQPPPPVEQKKPSPKEKAAGYYQLGVSYLQIGEIPLALRYFFKAKELTPDDPKIYNAIGLAFLERGDLDRSEKNFRKAISLKKDFSEAYLNLGIVYERKGNLKKARKFYKKALSNPLYLTPEVAYYRLALLDIKEKRFKEAMRNLENAIRNNPDYVPAILELAKLSEQMGNTERAKIIYLKLTEKFPKLQHPYCSLGELFLKEKNKKLAIKYLKSCVSINPNSDDGVKAKLLLEEITENE